MQVVGVGRPHDMDRMAETGGLGVGDEEGEVGTQAATAVEGGAATVAAWMGLGMKSRRRSESVENVLRVRKLVLGWLDGLGGCVEVVLVGCGYGLGIGVENNCGKLVLGWFDGLGGCV
ncbi:hypothetical protein SLA2020_348260 [Shorea laevis]